MIEIDRNKIYDSHGYKFKNFVCLTDEEILMILLWRNHDNVRKMMVNKDIISLEDHTRFINNLNNREDCYYWLVKDPSGVNIGVLDIIHIDKKKDEGEIGFYLNQDEMGGGFDFMIECNYFVYKQLALKYNLVTVDITNKDILLFNLYLNTSYEGIKEREGFKYLYSNHATGDYILNHYNDFSIIDYARFVRKHRNDDILYFIKD